MRKNNDSPAIQLLTVLWDGRQEATGHSWLRLNQSMRDGLMLAVRMGLRFGEDDFTVMNERFRFGYWRGESIEDFYRLAIAYDNRSAWKAYEKYVGRKPFLYPNSFHDHYGGGGPACHNATRMVVGSEFMWDGERVKVSSINDEKGYLVACSYTTTKGKSCRSCHSMKEWPKTKLLHRYALSHADLLTARRNARKPRSVEKAA